MAYEIKYDTNPVDNTIKKGNFALAINNVAYGPTSTTDFYAGIDPPSGGYTTYFYKATGGPSIRVANNDAELIEITNPAAQQTFTTAEECLEWFSTQNDALIVSSTDNIFPIPTDSSLLNFNAGFSFSYPTTGSVWYDISGNGNSGSLINNPLFDGNKSITFDGSDDYIDTTNSSFAIGTSNFTIEGFAYKNAASSVYSGIIASANSSNGIQVTNRTCWIGTGTIVQGIGNNNFDNFPADEWFHFAFRRSNNGTELHLKVNGEDILTPTVGSPGNVGSTTFRMGQRYANNNSWPWNGYINSVKVYDRALSDTEIKQSYLQAPIVTDNLALALDAGNLVSYESGSTTTYSLTGSLSGSLFNGTGFNRDNGGSFVFDGADDYIGNSTLNYSNKRNFTYITFVRSNGVLSNARRGICNIPISSGYLGFFGWQNPSNSLLLETRDSTNTYLGVGTPTVNIYDGLWHFVGFTVGEDSMSVFYNDGDSVTIQSIADTRSGNFNIVGLNMGIDQSNFKWNGNIANSLFYSQALTLDEITQNFNAQRKRFGL